VRVARHSFPTGTCLHFHRKMIRVTYSTS
jgi:hypothetical protein